MSTTITVQIDQIEAVRKFLESLNVNATEIVEEEEKEEIPQKFEIQKILNDRLSEDGFWSFEILFKGYKKPEWVDDCDCDCEETISQYCSSKGIRTIYCFCRVSTKNQVGPLHVSLEAQEQELRNSVLSARNDFAKLRIKTIKISASAYRNIPDALSRIGSVCKKDDKIIIYRVDRLSRNLIKYLDWLEDLDNRGVIIQAHSEKIEYSKNKLAFLQGILDANKESALLGDRIKMSLKKRKDRGDEAFGKLVYGKKYQRDVVDGHLKVVDDLDALAIIEKIIKLSKEGKDMNEITKILGSEGIKKYNKKWTMSMVSRVIVEKPGRHKCANDSGTDEELIEEIPKRHKKNFKRANDPESDEELIEEIPKRHKKNFKRANDPESDEELIEENVF